MLMNDDIILQICTSLASKGSGRQKGLNHFFSCEFLFPNITGNSKESLSNLISCKAHTATEVSYNNLHGLSITKFTTLKIIKGIQLLHTQIHLSNNNKLT